MRDNREYAAQPPHGTLRIAAFGDSFTYGSDVLLHESWAKRLATQDESLQILNFGVGAYGLDQAYLRYLQHKDRHHPHIVFIGYMSRNLERHVNVYRPFYSRIYSRRIFTKPHFQINDGNLVRWGHSSSLGNRIVAKFLEGTLNSRGLADVRSVEEATRG